MKVIHNLLEVTKIAQDYKFFIVDIWGVLHNGVLAYNGSLEAMEQLMQIGDVILLSNAPRRSSGVEKYLEKMGYYKGKHYKMIVTSGEVFHQHLAEIMPSLLFFIGQEKDIDQEKQTLLGSEFKITQDISAHFSHAVVTGPSDPLDITKDFPALQGLAIKKIPLFCPNPDVIVHNGNTENFCAGAIAAEYQALGGKVIYFGKPYETVYLAVFAEFQKMNPNFTKSACLAIGDILETDILGAITAKIKPVLCSWGIHKNELFVG